MTATDCLVWISGATSGLGSGLVCTCPYENARIINLSRSQHPGLETVRVDLTDPATWGAVRGPRVIRRGQGWGGATAWPTARP